MDGKEFIKNEPILFKIIYLIGIVFLFVNLSDLTNGKKEINIIFPILAFATLAFFFIRMAIFSKKNDN
jgi:uncharacterized membrane protein